MLDQRKQAVELSGAKLLSLRRAADQNKLVKDENGNVVNGATKFCHPLHELWGNDFLLLPRMVSKDNRANLDSSKIYNTVWLMGLSHVNLAQLHPIL